MKRNLACVREGAAIDWLAGYDPEDGHGPLGDQAKDPMLMVTRQVVIDGFVAGADYADIEFLFERQTGQRQLDDAAALIMEAVALFRSYEGHHRDQAGYPDADTAAQWVHDRGRLREIKRRLEKAGRNALMAERLEAWLRGEDRYPVSLSDEARCGISYFPIPAEIAANGDLVPVDAKGSGDIYGNVANFGVGAVDIRGAANRERDSQVGSNVRSVTVGPLADPDVVEGLMAGAGLIDATSAISVATATAFRLQTGDPRFDPAKPVLVNGYLYHPATEA